MTALRLHSRFSGRSLSLQCVNGVWHEGDCRGDASRTSVSVRRAHTAFLAVAVIAVLPSVAAVGLSSVSQPVPGRASGVHVVRIQKTGGSTLADIIGRFCNLRGGSDPSYCAGDKHLDWDIATEKGWREHLVTLLRDPVERTLSEFFFLRTDDGKSCASTPDWDFRNRTWLNFVEFGEMHTALNHYLHGDPFSPSRNRQALYLLGFKRSHSEDPGRVYDWDADGEKLLRRAKHHLDMLTAFGITDCYLTSMRVIGKEFRWPVDDMVEQARTSPDRVQDKEQFFQKKGRWRDSIQPEMVEDIERLNAVDMELYRYARQRFTERFGEECVED